MIKSAEIKDGVFLLDGEPTRFKTDAFACSCCGRVDVDERVIRALVNTEKVLQFELIINCSCRCVVHNAKVGGGAKSSHIILPEKPSFAIDFERKDKSNKTIFYGALLGGFRRVGVYLSKHRAPDGSKQSYFHADVAVNPLYWYHDGNGYHYHTNADLCLHDYNKNVILKKEGT